MASPYPPTPASSVAFPPNKRQKLSPNPTSPSPYATSPSLPALSLPSTPGSTFQQQQYQQPPLQQMPQYQQQQNFGSGIGQNGFLAGAAEYAQRAAPPTGTMGPPMKPADKLDKPMDINDLNDLVTSSGIDIREEENYLAQSYRNQHHTHQQHQTGAQHTAAGRQQHASTSFTSNISQSPTSIATSPTSNFQNWSSQSSFGPYQQGAGGPIQEAPVTQLSVEEELTARHKAAARQIAELRQHHVNDPFIHPESLRFFVQKRTYANGIRMLADPIEPAIRRQTMTSKSIAPRADVRIGSQDGRAVGIVEARGNPVLGAESAQSEILALLSLAVQERMRTVLEDASAYSRSRRLTSQGVVPPEWADISTGQGKGEQTTALPQSISETSWDKPQKDGKSSEGKTTVSKKRPAPDDDNVASSTNLPTPPTDTPPSPLPTYQYPALVPASLKDIGAIDRKLEEARLARRNKRRKITPGSDLNSSLSTVASPAALDSTNPNTPKATAASSTSSAPPPASSDSKNPATTTPSQQGVTKMTKKERERAARGAAQTEEALHKNANATASMALGGFGKSYSWLSGASKGGAGGGFGASSRSGTATPVRKGTGTGGAATPKAGAGSGTPATGAAGAGTGGAAAGAATGAKGPLYTRLERKWGEWKEEGRWGRGIQARDWARAIEADGKVQAGFVRAWNAIKGVD